jgi:calcium-dependent protein kinase
LQSLNSFHGSGRETPRVEDLPTILAQPSWQSSSSSNSKKSPVVQRDKLMRRHKDTKRLEDFYEVSQEKLGEGGFGIVRCARLKNADLMRVVKSVEKKIVDAADRAKREIEILKHLDHPNICRLHESFEDTKHIHIVMEYIKGRELYDEVLAQGHLDEESAVHYMSQIFSALQYCHQRRIMHRDLKPENVMVQHASDRTPMARTPRTPVSGGSVIKVIDFGLATLCTAGLRQSTVIGTKHYIAPEVMRGNYDYPADVWSAGVIFHTLLVGRPPSESFRNGDANAKLIAMQGGPWCGVSEGSKQLIVGVLEIRETERHSAKVALSGCTEIARALTTASPGLLSSFSSPLSERHAAGVMSQFMAFHRSEKLQRAALTAVAMQLTDSQMNGLREKFQAIDVNRDGHITREELDHAMTMASSGQEQQAPFGKIKSIFDAVDTDGSGLIDYSEFCAAALKSGALRCEEAILAAFRVFDVNGDGQISKAELEEVIVSQGTDPEELDKLLDPWDVDGDGQLSLEEFRSMVLNIGMEITAPKPIAPACQLPPQLSSISKCTITSL